MAKKKEESQSAVKIFIIALVMIGLVVGYYFHLSNKRVEAKENNTKSLTEVDEVLLRNLDTDYPPSPKEVVKYYAAITKCFYDGQFSDYQLQELASRSRDLLDDELKANQTDAEYLESLKFDISSYKDKDIKISSYSVSSSVDVEYKTTEKGDLAMLYCLYNLRQGSTLMSSNHEFILRKDEKGHWKILGWALAKDENDD